MLAALKTANGAAGRDKVRADGLRGKAHAEFFEVCERERRSISILLDGAMWEKEDGTRYLQDHREKVITEATLATRKTDFNSWYQKYHNALNTTVVSKKRKSPQVPVVEEGQENLVNKNGHKAVDRTYHKNKNLMKFAELRKKAKK